MIIGAEDAMKQAIGGGVPDEKDILTREGLRATIMATEVVVDYNSCANIAAKWIVEFLEEDPTRAEIPVENVYEQRGADGFMVQPIVILAHGLYDAMKDHGYTLDHLGLTGFMWSWAVNAARYVAELPVQLPPVPNPAIITVKGTND